MGRRTLLVIGAGSGIGRATAIRFHREGWQVALADINGPAVRALEQELGEGSRAFEVDILDVKALQSTVEAIADWSGGRIEALFNSAGLLDGRLFEEAPIDRLQRIIDINVKGVINAIHVTLPWLIKAPDARVISMGSAAAIYGVPWEAVYSASKFALRGLTEALNLEFQRHDIWVCDLMVLFVDTPMARSTDNISPSNTMLAQFGLNTSAEEIAETVLAATREKRVHWLFSEVEREHVKAFDATPWEERGPLMRSAVNFTL